MKAVQDALKPTGIPAYATAWRKTAANPTAPDRYLVYTTMTTENSHHDDAVQGYRVHVYLNLWTKADPTNDIVKIRAAMRAAGFAMADEMDSYNDETGQTLVAWTWVGWTEAE